MIVAALLAGDALAAACCGGPPVDPVVLGPGEQWAFSMGAVGGVTPLRWMANGSLHGAEEARAGGTLGVRARLAPWAQLGVVVPAGFDTVRGAGLDDPTLLARFEPDASTMGTRPRLLLFATAPLGRRTDDLGRWWSAGGTLSVEHAGHHSAAAGYATATLPVWAAGDPSVVPGWQWDLGAAWGPRGDWGSLIAGAGVRGTLPGRIDGSYAGIGAVAPQVRLLWTASISPTVRVVTGLTAGPPVPYLGRNDGDEFSATCTAVFAGRRLGPRPRPAP